MSTPIQFSDKADFIAALKAARPAAVKRDREALAKHKADRKAEVEAFKAKCQQFGRMSAAALEAAIVEQGNYGSLGVSLSQDSRCPTSQVAVIDRALAALEQTSQKTFTVSSDSGSFTHLYRFVNPPVSDDLCADR